MVIFVASMRIVNYGDCTNRLDEYLQPRKTVSSDTLKSFCRIVVNRFNAQYLNRRPTPAEKESVLEVMKQMGFPGWFASWDCNIFCGKTIP